MCGRYTQTLTAEQLAAAMGARDETGGAVRENYNVAPTSVMPIVVAEPGPAGGAAGGPRAGEPSAGAAAPAEAGRVLTMATWGLVPAWAKDPSIGSRLINARAETAASKPAFRAAYAARRCLVPATGYYEWHRTPGSRRGQPYFIYPAGHPGGDGLFAFAGLYEVWKKGEQPLTTFTILTTGAAEGLEFIHDRSPVVVPRSAWARWLDPSIRGGDALAELLRPPPLGVFAAHPVGAEVGSVRNRGPHLIEPTGPAVAVGGPPAGAPDTPDTPADLPVPPGDEAPGENESDRITPQDLTLFEEDDLGRVQHRPVR